MARSEAKADFRRVTDDAAPAIAKFWVEAVEGANKEYSHDIVCKCGRRTSKKFTVPDIAARTKAAEMLLQYGWGKPGATAPERDLDELAERAPEELTAAERRVLLAQVRKHLAEGDPDADQPGPAAES